MKKFVLTSAVLCLGLLCFISCGKESDDGEVADESKCIFVDTRSAETDEDGLYLDKIEASDIHMGYSRSRNGLLNIYSTLPSYRHWCDMYNNYGSPCFNSYYSGGTLVLNGYDDDILDDYCIGIMFYTENIWESELIVACATEGNLDVNLLATGSAYLGYHSYNRDSHWDIADSIEGFFQLFLTRENGKLLIASSYYNDGDMCQIFEEEICSARYCPWFGEQIVYNTYASNELVFGDTSGYESSVGHYPTTSNVRIGTIYVFDKSKINIF